MGAQIDKAILSGSPAARKTLAAHVHQLRAAMVPELWNPAPETLALLALKPEIAATLLGVQPSCRLPLQTDPQQLSDLDLLSHRMAVIGDQEIQFHETEKQGYLIVNVDALCQDLKKAGVNISSSELSSSLYDLEERQNPLRLFTDSLNQATRKSARVAAQALQTQPTLKVDGPHSLRQVGLIAYCDSDDSVRKLQQSLTDWDQNFATFGHQDRTLRLCDDSPEPYAQSVRSACQNFQSQAGTQVQYLGRQEKEEIRQAMIEAILASPTRAQLQAAGETVDRPTIDAMTRAMFGGQGPNGYRSGPTENRNLSTLLLQGSRSFQADHDMLPRVETSTADRLRRSLGYQAQLPPPGQRTTTTPVDLLSQLRHQPGDRISSPQFCGATDPPIDYIVEGSILPKDRLSSQPPATNGLVGGGRPVDEAGHSGVFRTASPMLLPRHYDQFLPLSPTIRDGDIAVGYLMTQHGGPQARELSRFILHTEKAGSKWGGEAHLLHDTLTSQALLKTLYSLKSGGAFGDSSLDAMADGLLERIRSKGDLPEAREASAQLLDSHADLIDRYIRNRDERSQALQGLLHDLSGDANQRRKALRQWYRPENEQADKLHEPHPRHSSSVARQEVEQALQASLADAQAMRTLQPPTPQQAAELRQQMADQVTNKLHDYALCLKFRHEILEVTARFGGPAQPTP